MPFMPASRRHFLCAAAAFAAAPVVHAATASDWPQRPVRLLVPFPPGGGLDAPTRLLADKLQKEWKEAVVVENKPGANTLIAMQELLKRGDDRHSFLITHQLSFNLPTVLSQPMAFQPSTELTLVSPLILEQLVLVARKGLPGDTLRDVLDEARRRKTPLKFGSYSIGSVAHMLALELAKSGVEVVHVPYRGTPAVMVAMLSGDIDIGLTNYGTGHSHWSTGRLKVLAVTGDAPYKFLPGAPTLQQQAIAGFRDRAWVGVFAPKTMPSPIVERAGVAVANALRSPELTEQLAQGGQEPGTLLSLRQFRDLMDDSIKVTGAQLAAAGVKLDG